jgi:hypothetical protein
MSLPPLPPISSDAAHLARSPDVTRAVASLQQMYFTASAMLMSGNFDLQRVRYHQDSLIKTGLPLLATLEEVAETEFIPIEWLRDTVGKFSALLLELLEAENVVDERCMLYLLFTLNGSNICNIEIVQIHEYLTLSPSNVQDDEVGLVSALTLHFYGMPWIIAGTYTFRS